MKTKSPLVLMELLIMLAVFALTAVICLRMFVLSDQVSRRSAAVDRAVLTAQSVSEQLKHGSLSDYMEEQGATCTDGNWLLFYDAQWTPLSDGSSSAYRLSVTYEDSGDPLLWFASVSISTAEGEELIVLPVSGQIWEGVAGNA